MPYVREAYDPENPAIAKLDTPKAKQFDAGDEEREKSYNCRLLRAGWFWASVIAITTICIAAPIGVATTRRLNAPTEGTPQYRFKGSIGLNTSTLSSYDPAWGLDASKNLTCSMVAQDLPTGSTSGGSPPPPLKLQGGQLLTVEGGKAVSLHGVNWFGFNNGKTFVDGLDAETSPSWEGGDFATVVYTLRLLGFNAVRLPFLFSDLGAVPQDYSKDCPGETPSSEELASRATNPVVPKPNAPVPYKFVQPEGSKPGRCNAYVPNGDSTLARYLWTVRYLVAHGFYVVIDYHPFGEDLETSVTSSLSTFVNAWLRVWMSLKCLASWSMDLQGRVFFDLMNEPDAMGIVWGGGGQQAPLEDYYLTAMDAIDRQAPGQAMFLVQGGGQQHLGSNWGDGFVTDPKWIQDRNLSDAHGFFQSLASKPYREQVALAPHMYGPSISNSNDVGPAQWEKYAVSWGHLLKPGYCSSSASSSANSNSSCQPYPVIAGEIGSRFLDPADTPYMNDMAAFFDKDPKTTEYSSARMPNWFWWAYNANSADTGGLVEDDWKSLNWQKLQWLQDNLGLNPWYKQ